MHRLAKCMGMIVLAVSVAAPGNALAIGLGGGSAEDKLKEAIEAVEEKDYKEAIELLQEVLEDDARNADALNYLGYSYRKLGNYEWALTYYRKALEVDPNHRGANEYIGEAYLELKQPENAKMHLDRLAKICGTSCEAYRELKKAFDSYQAKARAS